MYYLKQCKWQCVNWWTRYAKSQTKLLWLVILIMDSVNYRIASNFSSEGLFHLYHHWITWNCINKSANVIHRLQQSIKPRQEILLWPDPKPNKAYENTFIALGPGFAEEPYSNMGWHVWRGKGEISLSFDHFSTVGGTTYYFSFRGRDPFQQFYY